MRLVIISISALSLAPAASAQAVAISSARTPEQRAAAFDAADANKDGKLDLAEFKKAVDPAVLAQLPDDAIGQFKAQRDTDNDGYVSRDEFLAPGRVEIQR